MASPRVGTPGTRAPISSDQGLSGYHIHTKKLGEGGFGKVYLATHLHTNQKVAIKIMSKSKLGDDLPRVRTEIQTLKVLQHENIAKLLQVSENSTEISLVLEYCSGGELFDYLISKRRLIESEVRVIMIDLFNVLQYIHSRGFAHRDLKPENILFDENQRIKLIDFGLAANANFNCSNLLQLQTCCGSPAYAAPELLRGETYSGPAIDVWSSGVLLYSLLVGSLPFDDEHIPALYKKILTGKFVMPIWLTGDVRDLISAMLKTAPDQRITVAGVLNHRWTKKAGIKTNSIVNHEAVDKEAMTTAARFFPDITPEEFSNKTQNYDYHTATYLLLKNNPNAKKVAQEKQARRERMFTPKQTPTATVRNAGPTLDDKNLRIAAIKRKLALEGEFGGSTPNSNLSTPTKRGRDEDSKRFGVTTPFSDKVPAHITAKRNAPQTPVFIVRPRPCIPPRNDIVNAKPATVTKTPPAIQRITDKTAKKIISPRVRTNENRCDSNANTPIRGTPINAASIKSPLRDVRNQVLSSPRTPISNNITPARKQILKASTSKKSLLKRLIASATPAKTKEPRKLTTSTQSNNITMTTFQNPQECIDRLVHTLTARGVECKQKEFVLKCLFNNKIHTPLRFELEICTFNGLCVIHRKRLRGDPWNYKKICELVLVISNEQQLAALGGSDSKIDAQTQQSSVSSIENRPPPTYLMSTNL